MFRPAAKERTESTVHPQTPAAGCALAAPLRSNPSASAHETHHTAQQTSQQATPTEALLLPIWQDALRLSARPISAAIPGAPSTGAVVSVEDNFFALGGDSLIAMQIAAQLNTILQRDIAISAIFDHPTIRQLAAYIDQTCSSRGQQSPALVERLSPSQSAPLSFAQEHMWLLHQLQPDSTAYNVELTIRLRGDLQVVALQHSLQEIVRRHAALRTAVTVIDGRPLQVVNDRADLPIHFVDLSILPAAAREDEMLRLAGEEVSLPFDLEGPLVRAALYRLTAAEHVLQVSAHHMAADEWALGLLAQELAALYTAFRQGQESPLPPLPVQYADYAAWERNWYAGERQALDLAYWSRHAANVPALSLPTDHPRPALQSARGALVEITPAPELVQAIKQFSRAEGTTYYITLLAAFHVLMARYSGQDDFAVGVPMANRQWGESAKLIGTFMNTLPVRGDFSGSPSFREFVQRLQRTMTAALDHQQLPFEQLVSELHPARDLSHTPFYQVICNGLTMPVAGVHFGGLQWEYVTLPKYGAQVDLELYIIDSLWQQKFVLEYSTDLFDAGTMQRMLAQYQVLLRGILTDPDCALERLPLLPAAERELLLYGWNRTRRSYPRNLCVHDLVAAQAARTPDAVAVVFEDRRITFAELEERASRLAAYLRSAGISPGAFVGICLSRSIDMVVALLGILKAGAAYLPLDPAFPLDRLAYMLEDAQAPLLITQDGLLPELMRNLPPHGPQIVYLDRQWQEIMEAADAPNVLAPTPDDLAYIIYTSGSTGKPKGVQLRHRNVVNFLLSMQEEPGLTAQDKLLSVTTLSFDIAVLELFLPLITGAQVILASQDVAHDGRRLADYLAACGATLMQATPATWRMLIAAGWEGTSQLKALCGGEALPADLAQQLLQRVGSLWNMYGPTETTVWSTVERVTSAAEPILIGRPIANTQLYLLDAHRQPVPTGVVGELYIGGEGVARGYLNRPDLTAERFVPDPFSNQPWARLYRTGDLARYRADGAVEFLGRADHQVKVRGFRIELGEIESALHDHPAVAQAVVTASDDGAGGKYLAAYITSRGDAPATPAALRDFLAARLPHYMLPSAVVPLDAFPLTPNGKVDRKRLPRPDQMTAGSSRTYAPPRTPLELQLVQIWEGVLGRQPVGIHDNFFEIGGHSLSAARLFVQIESTLGRRLPLATLFQAPTVAQLAAAMQDDRWTPPWSPLVPIQPLGSRPPFFCVHGYGGDVVGYRDLAQLLGTDQPFYGLQARGLNDAEPPHTDIAGMAADYVRHVRRLQPQGPYYLGGYCYGAVIAHEMARQLEAQGERVNLLAVLEGYAVEREEARRELWRPQAMASFARNLPHWLADQLHPAGPYGRRMPWGSPPPDADVADACLTEFDLSRRRLKLAQDEAMAGYRPGMYGGRVTLFRVQTMSLFRAHDPALGWGKFAGEGVTVRMIDGAHYNFLEQPYVQSLAAQLRASLEDAQRE